MITLTSYIILGFLGICIGGFYFFKTYSTPRVFLVALTAFLLLLHASVYGVSVYFSAFVLQVVLLLLGWWLLCSIISPRPDIAIPKFITMSSIVIITGLLSKNYLEFGVCLMVSSAILSCVYAIIQNKFKYEFLKRSQNTTHYYPVGFIGNQNMHANWLVPNVFMAGWLAQNMSLWWLASIPLLVYVIKLNHCRTAYIGLLIGGFYSLGLYVGFLFAGVSLAILSLIYLIGAEMSWWTYGHGGITTLKERINYWRVALRQIRKTPIFGVGFDVFQTKVPFLQLEINEQTKGEFLKPENYECPYPQKCHNDYLQHVLDNGFIGLVGILFLVGLALSAEISSLLVAAFVSLLACGLFFHTFHVIMTNIIFWFLCFTLIRSGGEVVTLLTIPWYVVIIFGVLFLKYTLSRTLFDITFHDYFRNNCTFPPTKALKHNPKSSMVHTYAGQYYFKTGNITKMFEHSLSALAYHDGAQRYWELWSNLGTACFLGGGLALAEHCHKTALKFWPEHKNAKKALDELNRLRQHFVTVTPVNPNEKMVEKKAI